MNEQTEEDDHDPMIGRVVGHYKITEELDVGGMGAVYRAVHELMGKQAAVKLLRPELSSDPEMVRRFFNEAKAASAIRHPGIVEIFDFGYHADGRAYLVMEFLDGHTLSARIVQRGRLPELEAAVIARGIASALAAAHAKGIVHRDLKPENVFLVPDSEMATGERTKVLDFGIAKLANQGPGDSAKTRTGQFMGTPAYIAPEQARGAGDVDLRADLYSLGCMMYELVVGEPPFVADGAGEVIALQLFGEVEPPRNRVPDLSPAFEALVMRCLEKDPALRPRSAAEVTEALSKVLPGLSSRLSAVLPAAPRTTASRPVITPAPRPARMMTPQPGAQGDSMMHPPTTLAPAAGEEAADEPRRSRTGLWIVLAALVVAVGAAVIVFGLGGKDAEPAPHSADPAPVAAPTPPPEDIVISLTLDPAEATVTVDGTPIDAPGGILRLPRDGAVHKVEIAASGHVTRSFPLKADRDQSASIALAPAPVVAPPPIATPEKPVKREPKKKRPRGKGKGDGKGDGGGPIEESL